MSAHLDPKTLPANKDLAMTEKKQNDQTTLTGASNGTSNEPARRTLIGSGAVGAAAVMLGMVAAACGSDEDTPAGSAGAGGKNNAGSGGRGSAGGAGKSSAGGGGKSGATSEAGAGGADSAGAAGIAGMGEGGALNFPDADIGPLNALLAAEYNAITAYSAGAGLIGEAKAVDPLYPLREVITDIAVGIQTQHKLHAAALASAIEELDGTPIKQADVASKFKPPADLALNPTISNVLKFAASAERGATVAYNQVLAGLEDAKLRFLASSIEGDESQHFIVLTALVLGLAAPGANLDATTAATVFPEAFVSTVDTQKGLDSGVPDYFA